MHHFLKVILQRHISIIVVLIIEVSIFLIIFHGREEEVLNMMFFILSPINQLKYHPEVGFIHPKSVWMKWLLKILFSLVKTKHQFLV